MIYPLNGRKVAVLVIDAQEEYFDPQGPAFVAGAAAALVHINAVIEACRASGQLVVYIRHAHNPDGSDLGRMADFASPDDPDSFIEGTARVELAAGLTIVDGAPVISKTRYDSFAGTGLHRVLSEHGVTSVLIVGYMTSFCCASTARAAHSLDYEVLFVRDAVDGPALVYTDGSDYPSEQVKEDVCAQLRAGFAEIVSSAEVVDRVRPTGRSDEAPM